LLALALQILQLLQQRDGHPQQHQGEGGAAPKQGGKRSAEEGLRGVAQRESIGPMRDCLELSPLLSGKGER